MLRSIWENFDWLAQAAANEDVSLTGIWQNKEVYFSVCYCPVWEMRKIFTQMGNMRSCKPLPWWHEAAKNGFLPTLGTPWCCELHEGPFCMEINTRGNSLERIQPRAAILGRAWWEVAWGTQGASLCKTLPPDERTEMSLISDTPKVSGCSSACLCGSNSSSLLPLRLLADVSFFH